MWIDRRLPLGNRQAAGRHVGAWGTAARQRQAPIQLAQVGKPWCKTDGTDPVFDATVQGDHLTHAQVARRSNGGQVTTLRVDRNNETLRVDAVMLVPRHRPQLDRELERKLEGVLGRPVQVSLRELLTADEKAKIRSGNAMKLFGR